MQRFAARIGSNAIKRQSPTIKLSAYFSASSNTNSNTNSTNNYTKGDGSGDTSILREENDDREFYKGIPIGPPSDLEYPESTPHERYQAKKQKKLDDKVYNTENRYKLKGVLRKESGINNRTAGSKVSRRLRREGLIPGIIYGNDVQGFGKGADHPLNKTIEVVVKHTDIQAELRAHKNVFESRVYELEIEGSAEKFTVLPRHCELHPVQNQVMNCNFLRYWPGRVVSIPLKYVNQEVSRASEPSLEEDENASFERSEQHAKRTSHN